MRIPLTGRCLSRYARNEFIPAVHLICVLLTMDPALQEQISTLILGQLSQGLAPVVQMQAQLAAALQSQQAAAARATSSAAPSTDPAPFGPGGDVPDEEWTGESAWEDVLPQIRRTPLPGAGEALVARMQFAPPLDKVRQLQAEITGVQGVPETVPSRKHFRDRQLQQLQLKQEQVMNLLVSAVEATNMFDGPLITAAALSRSSWEDLQDLRRKEFAGRDAHKLDKRHDASSLRLLSPQEEKLMNSQRGRGKGKGKGRSYRSFMPQSSGSYHQGGMQFPPYYQSSNWREQPAPRPWKGGKGKGRSRSAQPTRSPMQE